MSTKTIARITNQAGAEVHVIKTGGLGFIGWTCTGCGTGTKPALHTKPSDASTEAAQHADVCRFQPRS